MRAPERRQALLSKLKRQRSTLSFELEHVRNRYRWSGSDLERDEWAREARLLTWLLIELADELREIEYG